MELQISLEEMAKSLGAFYFGVADLSLTRGGPLTPYEERLTLEYPLAISMGNHPHRCPTSPGKACGGKMWGMRGLCGGLPSRRLHGAKLQTLRTSGDEDARREVQRIL